MLDRARTAQGDLPGAVGFPPPDDALWTWVAGSGVDSVELKVLLRPGPGTGARFTVRHATRVRQRRLYLMDTPDLVLARAGVHVRLRDRGRDRWDVTVRLRGEGPVADLPRPGGARVELDVLPGHAFHSTELREVVDVDRALACRDGRLDAREVLTAAQGALLDEAAPGVATLRAHGPLAVERVTVPRPRCQLPHARHERCRFPGGAGARGVLGALRTGRGRGRRARRHPLPRPPRRRPGAGAAHQDRGVARRAAPGRGGLSPDRRVRSPARSAPCTATRGRCGARARPDGPCRRRPAAAS